MNHTVTLLLLASTGGKLTSAERQALATFQTREKVTLVAPRSAGAVPAESTTTVEAERAQRTMWVRGVVRPTMGQAGDVAQTIEASLDEAQTLAASLDEERALVLLADVEKELLLHPELPQAAWLMAERHQLAAAIRRKQPGGDEDAARLLASAEALEGPRAAPFGEGGDAAPENSGVAAPPKLRALLSVRDLDVHDELVVDGFSAKGSWSVLPGRHHAEVLRGSRVVWAGWFDVPAEARVDRLLGVPERLACSGEDFGETAVGGRAPDVPAGVRCERWIAVRRGATGLEVAWCEGPRCTAYGPLLAEQGAPKAAPVRIPPWLAATIVGATAVGAATLLVATGTFERERPEPILVPVYRGPP
jgi:hypothetical protein